MTIRVVVVDDHFVTRTGTIAILQREPRYEIVGEAEDGARALALGLELHPDLVLLDTRLPKMDGPTVARALQMMASPPRILMLSAYGDAASVRTALDAGATGYVFKSVGGAGRVEPAGTGRARLRRRGDAVERDRPAGPCQSPHHRHVFSAHLQETGGAQPH